MSWVEETLINAFCGARDAAALDAAQMGALSTGSTAAAAEASCRAALGRGAEALEDELLTSLRTAAGIDLTRIRDVYGSEYERAVRRGAQEAIELGLAVVEGEVLKLTDPDGFLFSNYALAAVFGEVEDVCV